MTHKSDANVGVVRQLTLEPDITSTRGFINPGSKDTVEGKNSANLFTPAELLTPLGVQHDDPDRTSINCLYLMSTLNLVNCWELPLGQSAAKLKNIKKEKVVYAAQTFSHPPSVIMPI